MATTSARTAGQPPRAAGHDVLPDVLPSDLDDFAPPYVEHPTAETVRARAADQVRALLWATRHEPGTVDPWTVSEDELAEIVETVLGSAWGTFRVAVAAWETAQVAALTDRPSTPAPAATAPARGRPTQPRRQVA